MTKNKKHVWFFANWNDGHLIECRYPMTIEEAIKECGGWKRLKDFTVYTSKEKFMMDERRGK